MIRSREVPYSPEYMESLQQDLYAMDPLEFLIALEEIEHKLNSENSIEIQKDKSHDNA